MSDASRPRVEGERVELGELVTAAEYADRDPFVVPMSRSVYATLLHYEFEVNRLTAEVERLRGVEGAYNALMAFAALALPTNAEPEVPNDES